MRALESAGGGVCSRELDGRSADVGGDVCWANATVAAASAAKANAARFMMGLLSLGRQTKHLPLIEAIGDGLH